MGQLITGLANKHSRSHSEPRSKALLIVCLWTVGGSWRNPYVLCVIHVSLMCHKPVVTPNPSNNAVKNMRKFGPPWSDISGGDDKIILKRYVTIKLPLPLTQP